MNVALVTGLLLMASLAGNGVLWVALDREQKETVRAREAFGTAMAAATTCDRAVIELQNTARQQAEIAAARIDRARTEARSANERAELERRRTPAVPGNACASAETENREWLQRRKQGATQ
ncbi:MAG: hypothetical protein AB7P94_16735 [Steroidobacteraceae bacterium]